MEIRFKKLSDNANSTNSSSCSDFSSNKGSDSETYENSLDKGFIKFTKLYILSGVAI